MTVVFDASALLAWLFNEPGGEKIEAALQDAMICSVNWAEVVQKSIARGTEVGGLREEVEMIGLTILPFDAGDAELAALLWRRGAHLSLGDRACLALGIRLGLPVWTADRAWATLSTGAKVVAIRHEESS